MILKINILCQPYHCFVSLRRPSWQRVGSLSLHGVIAEHQSEPGGHCSCPPLLVCTKETNQAKSIKFQLHVCMCDYRVLLIYLVLDSLVCWSIRSVISSFSTWTFTLYEKMILVLYWKGQCHSATSLDSIQTWNKATCTCIVAIFYTHVFNTYNYLNGSLLYMQHELISSAMYVHTYDFPWAVPVWIGVPCFQCPTLLPPLLGSLASSWTRLHYRTKHTYVSPHAQQMIV
jgi:hypothetical protein